MLSGTDNINKTIVGDVNQYVTQMVAGVMGFGKDKIGQVVLDSLQGILSGTASTHAVPLMVPFGTSSNFLALYNNELNSANERVSVPVLSDAGVGAICACLL